jgi:hypothetical protein
VYVVQSLDIELKTRQKIVKKNCVRVLLQTRRCEAVPGVPGPDVAVTPAWSRAYCVGMPNNVGGCGLHVEWRALSKCGQRANVCLQST